MARRGLCGDVHLVGSPKGPRIKDVRTDGSISWEKNIAPTAFADSTPAIIRVGKQDQMIAVVSDLAADRQYF